MTDEASRFHIISVEDDPSVAKGLILSMESAGYRVSHFLNGESFLRQIEDMDPSLLILDVRLPGKDGFLICREVRQRGYKFPILMLTARDDETDKIAGLEGGADDYMVKPFSLKELQSRIKAMLRRSYGQLSENPDSSGKKYVFGDFQLSQDHMKLIRNGEETDLTPMEFRLLLFFLKNRNGVFTRREILNRVWSADHDYHGDERTVDVHIRHLRKKIETNPSEPVFLKTLRGEGYRFELRKDGNGSFS